MFGPEYCTFSIAAWCTRTGMLGMAIATRPIAVGSRCGFIQPGAGAVVTQATTDPRLGPLGLRLLALGLSAPKALREIEASDPHIEHRQLAVVDRDGGVAARTGAQNKPWAGHVEGRGFVAMGNMLVGPEVAHGIARAYEAARDAPLEDRLLAAIEAGRDAGGQHGGQHSAALLVYGSGAYPYVDLRVDEHDEPIGELRRIFELYRPLIPYFYARPAEPTMPGQDEWLQRQRDARAH